LTWKRIFQQNTGHTHNTRTTTQPNTRTKHTTEPLSSGRRLRDDGACHLPRLGGWPRRSQHGKQGRSPSALARTFPRFIYPKSRLSMHIIPYLCLRSAYSTRKAVCHMSPPCFGQSYSSTTQPTALASRALESSVMGCVGLIQSWCPIRIHTLLLPPPPHPPPPPPPPPPTHPTC